MHYWIIDQHVNTIINKAVVSHAPQTLITEYLLERIQQNTRSAHNAFRTLRRQSLFYKRRLRVTFFKNSEKKIQHRGQIKTLNEDDGKIRVMKNIR